MTINKDAINATIEVMRNTKEYSFDMGGFVCNVYSEDTDYNLGPGEENICGTSCCLAGFAYIAETGKTVYPRDLVDYFTSAKDYFGLNEETATLLFIPKNKAIDLTDIDEGIKALEYLRDTGEVLWTDDKYKSYEGY